MLAEKTISWANQEFVFNNFKTVYWPEQKAIILSDLHLGKSTHFRKNGISIPISVAKTDLEKLKHLILFYSPEKVIVAGDFFHAEANTEIKNFQAWRNQFPNLRFILIKGNHDRLKNTTYQECGIQLFSEFELDLIQFVHCPYQQQSYKHSISGHIHPGILMKGKGKQKLKLPCFLLNDQQIILPAFSDFTGLDIRMAKQKDFRSICVDKNIIFEYTDLRQNIN